MGPADRLFVSSVRFAWRGVTRTCGQPCPSIQMQLLYGLVVHGRRRNATLSCHANQWCVSLSFSSSLAYLSLYIFRIIFYTVVFASYTMGSGTAAPDVASPVAMALALGKSPSPIASSSSNPKAHDIMEERRGRIEERNHRVGREKRHRRAASNRM